MVTVLLSVLVIIFYKCASILKKNYRQIFYNRAHAKYTIKWFSHSKEESSLITFANKTPIPVWTL